MDQVIPVVPVLLVVATACAVLLTHRGRRDGDGMPAPALAGIGIASALAASVLLWYRRVEADGLVPSDAYASFFYMAFCALALLTVTASSRPAGGGAGAGAGAEPLRLALLLLALVGMMVAAAARDLVVMFLAIEVAWGASLMLAGSGGNDEAATEAAFKTLILGAFAGAFLLYGIALVYAVTGTTRLDALAARVAASSLDPNILVYVSLVLLLAGLLFVVSAVPFHTWTPDTCSGTDARTAGFITTGLRLAGFAALLRVLLTSFEPLRIDWLPVLSAVAGLTMIVGAVVAVGQSNVRRLVAFAGVAHTGYIMMGLLSASQAGKSAVLFSLVAWGAGNIGLFVSLAILSASNRPHDDVRDFAGLGKERPALAILMTCCLLSLAGLPPAAGFVARWLVFGAALQEGLVALAVLGALTSVMLTFACLRLVVQMYMTGAHGRRRRPVTADHTPVGLVLVVVLLLFAGLWPAPLLAAALVAAAAIF